jgi:hypothetical protein
MERKATNLFNTVKKKVSKLFPGETNNHELTRFCKSLYGWKFSGVFSSDRIPLLNKDQSCIINLDDSTKPGSHWVAVARDNCKGLYFYDSFGRRPQKILPNLLSRYKTYQIHYDIKDKEQKKSEENCGANCVAFLTVYYSLGPRYAIKI